MPSRNTYHLTWVSLTSDVGYLFTAAPPDLERGVVPLSPSAPRSSRSLELGLLLSAAAPVLRRVGAPLGCGPCPQCGEARLGRRSLAMAT